MALSTAAKNRMIDQFFAGITFYLSLHDADPGSNGANEASGGSYARKAITVGSASGGSTNNSAAIDFTSLPAGIFSHLGYWDALTGGNFYDGDAMAAPITVGAGQSITVSINGLTWEVEDA